MMFKTIWALLRSELGQISLDGEPAEAAPEQDEGTGAVAEETGSQDAAPAQTDAAQTQEQEEHFAQGEETLDPRKLDPALQPIFKKMQGVYTKRMQELAQIRDRAAQVDRFYNDPAFAQQTLLQWANQYGYQVMPPGVQQQQAQQQAPVPQQLVEAFKKNLAPELQWMAEPQANAMFTALQTMLQPVLQQHEQQTRQQQVAQQQARAKEWDKYAEQLAEVAPGWEEHEGSMGELYEFLADKSQLFHPTFGSKLQMLYDLATARAASMKQAQQRVQSAAKNRVTSGRPMSRQPSVEDDILKADTRNAWEIAKRAALAKHKRPA